MDRPTHILVECPELIASVRVGVLEPLKPLEQSGKCEIKFVETKRIKKYDIAWSDILISVRGIENVSLKVAQAAKKAGRYIIYFLDDDLLDIPKNIASSNYFSDESQKSNLIQLLRMADVLWCVNPLIAEKYSCLGKGKSIISKVPVELPLDIEVNKDDKIINILYAGSVDHSGLVQEYISPVVEKLSEEYSDRLIFTFIGADPKLDHIANVKHYNFFSDYEEYKRLVAAGSYHIGLAPLYTTEFYKYKYYNKFIEYTLLGAVGVYTQCLPYTSVVEDKINGFLCENTFDGWYSSIKYAVTNKEARTSCVSKARNLLISEFSYIEVSTKLSVDIPSLINFRAKSLRPQDISMGNIRVNFYFQRIELIYRQYGIRSVPIIIRKILKKLVSNNLK